MDRSFPLQALAFRGEEVEPPQLRFRGLDLSSIPVGVKRLSLQCTLCFHKSERWSVIACILTNNKAQISFEYDFLKIIRCVLIQAEITPGFEIEKTRGPFLFATLFGVDKREWSSTAPCPLL
ncbi:hypothetical protein AF331_14040 [Rossellomorea marisflavi]|uniref:Uncharacterized protein n=1 Tax=Rossellomorea marisflavi TaxID=189381 RepID=A0A0M0G5F7_9BACI|nr:hypothetical protein AF331_14040 [Rossellomorea marisflavi]